MSYAFHRSQRHGPNGRYFPELKAHPQGVNTIPPELNAVLDPQTFGPLFVLYTKPGQSRRVHRMLSTVFPTTLSLYCPLTPIEWRTRDLTQTRSYTARANLNRKTAAAQALSGNPALSPTLKELYATNNLEKQIRLSEKIKELQADPEGETELKKLLAKHDKIPIKYDLKCQPIFSDIVIVGIRPVRSITDDQPKNGLFFLNSNLKPGEAPKTSNRNDREASGSFPQKNGNLNSANVPFVADPRATKPLELNTDLLGMTQTDLARKYGVPLVGRRLRRRDEEAFQPTHEVQPDAWWDDPYSYLPGPSKKYLPPPKAYVEWLSEEQALLTPSKLKVCSGTKYPEHIHVVAPHLRSKIYNQISEILDYVPIRERTAGFFIPKNQYEAFNELKTLTRYMAKVRPHPQTEQKANRLDPLKSKRFWQGLSRPYNNFLMKAGVEPQLLDLGPLVVFSDKSSFRGLTAVRLKNFLDTKAYQFHIQRKMNITSLRSKEAQLRASEIFKACMPPTEDVPEDCEVVLLLLSGIQQVLFAVVESIDIMTSNIQIPPSEIVSTFYPSNYMSYLGTGGSRILARNGFTNSKTFKQLDIGCQPDSPRLVLDTLKKAIMAFGVKPSLTEEILEPLPNL